MPKVQVTFRSCPHGCPVELTFVDWGNGTTSWLEHQNFAVTQCPGCAGRLP